MSARTEKQEAPLLLQIEGRVWNCHALVQAIEARAMLLEMEGAVPSDSTEPLRRLCRVVAAELELAGQALASLPPGGAEA